jgi:nucleoside-diphosphate-sugar epimerase
MKIFLTGTQGFIGRNLLEFYHGYEIFEHCRYMDIGAKLDYFKPDLIIHCAAEIYKPDEMWKSNMVMIYDILDYVKTNPSTKLIHIGSSSEYGPVPRAASETDRINPIDMYQATKGAGTLLCQGYARQYKLDIAVARAYSVYGKYEKPHRLFPRLWRAFQLDQPMKLFHGYHDFIYIDDFVRGIDTILNAEDKPLGDIVNLGSGIQYSNQEVLDLFEKITNKKGAVEVVPSMAKEFESEVWLCDTTYAKEQYGFETVYTLEQGIKEFLKTADYKQE